MLPVRNITCIAVLAVLFLLVIQHSAFGFAIRSSLFAIQAERVMPGAITVSLTDTLLHPSVIDAALALTFETTGKFAYLPVAMRDSILRTQDSTEQTAGVAAKKLGADAIAFTTVSRVQNLIRAELILATGDNYNEKLAGIGYASMNYAESGTNKPLTEPAILHALQRALQRALNNNELYNGADSMLRVHPTQLVVVGGVEFPTMTLDLPQWDLFRERTVASYDLVQTIVHALQSDKYYTVVDIESRDSMYAMAGLYLVENYRKVATEELRIMRLFDVRRVITGSFVRTADGSRVTLSLCAIEDNDSYRPIKTESVDINEDTKEAFHEGVVVCTQMLFR